MPLHPDELLRATGWQPVLPEEVLMPLHADQHLRPAGWLPLLPEEILIPLHPDQLLRATGWQPLFLGQPSLPLKYPDKTEAAVPSEPNQARYPGIPHLAFGTAPAHGGC